ncbi:MAG TPA: ArsI/CadI family heavy metal resistance metalloenzyme [Mucilaginibacter sp.]|jgi:catechol 2,3-dioxygenase-like lactoylglutathione lyase family enzyme
MKTSTFPRMHVSLYVSDLLQTISFYNLFFGKAPEKIRKGYVKYVLDEPSLIISFVESPERVRQNFGHLGFQVETVEKLNDRLAQAQRAGLITREEIGTNCCFAKQDKFWVTDNDKIQWEVYYFHEEAEYNDPHYEEIKTPAECCDTPVAEKSKIEFKNLAAAGTIIGKSCC